jgi:Helitron helicase-like domain at N-terminus
VIPDLPDPPERLRDLYRLSDGHAVEFRERIRHYNGALAFTSVNYKTDTRLQGGFRPFQIQGELYHLQGPLFNEPGAAPQYSQLWILDPQMAANARCDRDRMIDRATLNELTDVLREVNPYIDLYKTARDQLVTMEAYSSPDHTPLTAQLGLVMEAGADRRRENLPTASEVAGIIPDMGPDTLPSLDLSVTLRAPQDRPTCQRVSWTDPRYLPLHYVLLFPRGEPGWDTTMKLQNNSGERTRDRLTLRHYHAYRLFPREMEFGTLFRAGRLFQQYVVDAFACVDQNHLSWIRTNQHKIRADLYQGLQDALAASDTDEQAPVLGRRVVLPSSHTCSERFMHAAYQDAMAIAGRFRQPHLFITKTANPKWEEVQRELLPGQNAMDRPDLISRVFRLKKQAMLDDIFKKGIFGRCVARVWTIEYQKRGLPHLHMVIFLDHPDFLDPQVIDKIVCAELPGLADPAWNNDTELGEIVRSVMIHGPCGEHNPKAPCMEVDARTGRARCTKNFPRAFCEETIVGEDGYPLYRRRNSPQTAFEKTVNSQRVTIDNRWVVPYNPYLTKRYKAHINVEVCSSIKVLKYLYKYIYKGLGSYPIGPLSISH